MSYTDTQLRQFMAAPESHCLERKESFDRDKVCKTVCAFANDLARSGKAGVILLGVRDDGQVTGIDAGDKLLQSIDQITSDARIQPLPSVTARTFDADGKAVTPSTLPPVRFDGRVWVRMSASTRQANAQDEQVLNEVRRAKAGRPFDSEGIPGTSIDDLNLRYFQENYLPAAIAPDVLSANGRTLEEQLVTTHMALGTAPCLPTVTGLLTLGLSPQDFLAGAYVQFVRYAGSEQGGQVIDQETITGTLEDMIRRTEDRLKAQVTIPLQIAGVDRAQALPDYPMDALQQLFRNAVLHRSYEGTNAPIRVYVFDDRLEISNPGGPFGIVTKENFGQPHITDYRNRSIAGVLKNLGFVQTFGFGIQRARASLRANGNPAPEFTVEQSHVLVTVRKRQS
ncbi:MAG: putative DNA binding domain-containing protein [Azoarcus sp.]|jgi:ATP-dependent DNA helicase RecG|nr:putative DNA binding domain-containing protein [Azoarcus sp.]